MVYQGDCCGFNSDIVVVVYGDFDICLGQCWGVVNFIVNYCYFVFLVLQMFNGIGFIVWQYVGDYFINVGFFGDSFCGGGVIFGKYYQLVVLLM